MQMINGHSGMQTRNGGNRMINVTKEQLHKCIFISFSDFKSIINKLKPDVTVTYCEHKLSLATDSNNSVKKKEVLQELSVYFNVTVIGFHADDSDDTGVWILYNDKVLSEEVPCGKCFNARFNDEITDENDFASYTVGQSEKGYRMTYNSGYGKPPRIEFDAWNESCTSWDTVGVYFPKCCPECGREITEYNEKRRKD